MRFVKCVKCCPLHVTISYSDTKKEYISKNLKLREVRFFYNGVATQPSLHAGDNGYVKRMLALTIDTYVLVVGRLKLIGFRR